MKRSVLWFLMIFIFVTTYGQNSTIKGFFEKNVDKELRLEQLFDKNLNAENIGKTIKTLSEYPHHIGSPGDKKNADYILNQFKSWGWDAEIETFYVLFPTPETRVIEMISPLSFKAALKEPALKDDQSSGQSGQLPVYNAYSADGDVTAGLVFVNYGLPEDYETLYNIGVDVRGKIVIAKYGRSWRGIKPKVAQEHGALGCLIYSDPADDGYFYGDVYPKGSFRNEYGAQRGSVMDLPVYPGDPLTPGAGAEKDAKRLERSQAMNLLKIPVLPVSYHDATPLLKALEGPVAPVEWHGGLPFAYHIGNGQTKVHLKATFNWNIVPCYDVIAKIKGADFPDEWVIRGNHQDAWVNGATDPSSGQAAMLEEAKSIGNLLLTGWRPRRTIVYCAWDGEEPGLLGSTEWVEEHEKELKEKAVLYINTDGNGRGFLSADGSQALEPFMDEIAKQVIDPQTNVSIFLRKKDHEIISAVNTQIKKQIREENELRLGALGSGSDYSSFTQHAGIPALNLGFSGEDLGGEYHSIYDSWDFYVKFKDPGFRYGVALAETAGHAILRMADADILPFDFLHLLSAIKSYSSEVISNLNVMRESTEVENQIINSGGYSIGQDPTKGFSVPEVNPEVPFLDFSLLQNSLQQLTDYTDSLDIVLQKKIRLNSITPGFNTALYRAEQQLLNETGLPFRSWYRHTIYAPGFYTGYGVKTLPGIREAIEERNWKEAQKQIETVAKAITRLAQYFKSLTSPAIN